MAWSICRRYLQNYCFKNMDNKHTDAAEILDHLGVIDDLSLENLFNSAEGNDDFDILSPSQYYTIDNLPFS